MIFQIQGADFQVQAAGWNAVAGQSVLPPIGPCDQRNPLGAAFAACLGVADAFKVASGLPSDWRIKSAYFDLFHMSLGLTVASEMPEIPCSVDLGTTLLEGLGSVGSATAYLPNLLPIAGSANLIDHDTVGYENLNRSPMFTFRDVGRRKVDVVAEYLQGTIMARPFPMRFDEYLACERRGPGDIDLIFAMANEFGVRALIENNMPPLQVYGTTAPSGVVNFHRHIPLLEDCSVCRFPPLPEGIEPLFFCSDAQVELAPGTQIDAALPFMSVVAAIFAVAELVRRSPDNTSPVSNFAEVDLMGR